MREKRIKRRRKEMKAVIQMKVAHKSLIKRERKKKSSELIKSIKVKKGKSKRKIK